MKKTSKILLTTALVISLAGCGKIPTLKNGDEAVFTTDSKKISVTELYNLLKDKYGSYVLVDLIDKTILEEKYESTDDEKEYIDTQISNMKSQAEQYGATIEQLISYYGYSTLDEYKDYLSLSYKRDLAVNDYLKENLTEKEMKEYYENNIYGTVNVKHILIAPETKDGMTEEETKQAEADALKTAKKVIKKLNEGSSWDSLAKKYSTDDATKDKGGDLGWIAIGDTVKEFETAAFALEKDKYTTEPINTMYGYHIIYKVDEKDKPSYKESKSDIKDALVKQKLSEDSTLYYSVLDTIRKEAGLDIIDSDLKSGYSSYLNKIMTSAAQNQNNE